ncbi:hypothetical protein [Pseudorhodoferax sp.]|uniref:hypothetical protein n=1 Tax=Pseudorhodoferax sp. TaxID=1993553 RepID=UPI002DD66FE7|nr:hypothetical protein [Pseudorhodoferax sp.]
MTRLFPLAAFAAGLLVPAWVAAGYVPDNPLALALVLLIVAFYLLGVVELWRFHQASAGLARVLAETTTPPEALAPWLARLPAALQGAVRQRAEGERVTLPGLALAPHLAGLLVLLGMLGTFVGMVATLRGTGLALEGAADVEAIRATLAAPVKGLGLAFGCSVAGVAASAMLGLLSALARRQRLLVARQLERLVAGPLRDFSLAHLREQRHEQQREQALQLLRQQGELLPALVTQLQQLVARVEHQGDALQQRLIEGQARFHGEAERAYTGLALSVDRSLQASLAEGTRLAAAAIEPAVQATLAGLARETTTLQGVLGHAVQQHLAGSGARLDEAAQALGRQSAALLEGLSERMAHSTEGLLRSTAEAHAALDAAATAREQARQQALRDELQALAGTLQQESRQTSAAAAAVIGELRAAASDSLLRDNAALDERNRLLTTLGGLLDTVRQAGTEQRAAIDALVQAGADLLDRVGSRFAETVQAEAHTLQTAATQVAVGAAEVASLGEGFAAAVQLFSRSNEQMVAQLGRIEAALGHSLARSDEQLAYYVAQAREIIDLTLGAQKQVVDELQQLTRAPA